MAMLNNQRVPRQQGISQPTAESRFFRTRFDASCPILVSDSVSSPRPKPGIMVFIREIIPFHGLNSGYSDFLQFIQMFICDNIIYIPPQADVCYIISPYLGRCMMYVICTGSLSLVFYGQILSQCTDATLTEEFLGHIPSGSLCSKSSKAHGFLHNITMFFCNIPSGQCGFGFLGFIVKLMFFSLGSQIHPFVAHEFYIWLVSNMFYFP